jgi:rubrerythrin
MMTLANKNREKLLDLLTERLTFERAGVKLYESLIEKVRGSGEPAIIKMLDQLEEHRDEEKEHEEWLEQQIRALGGDAHGSTDLSRLTETESKGIEQVILSGDEPLPHMFHAILAAELVDNAGWELLVRLADEADDGDAKRAFRTRLQEEGRHLIFVRRAVEGLTLHSVLGETLAMPTSP